MLRILILLMILSPVASLSQEYINKTRIQVKKELKNYETAEGIGKTTVTETDSTVLFSIRKSGASPTGFKYAFDKKGKCISEKVEAGCDSCLVKYLQEVLAKEKYHWKKINENQYVSDYASKLMIELPPEKNIRYFKILRMDWSKELYDILMEK